MTRNITRLKHWAICLAAISIATSLVSKTAEAAYGRTTGIFDVSPTGAATYTIPIWMPKGPNGLQPNLSIVYDSNSPDGTMGPGWFLSGLGAISRCNKTYAQDTTAGPVALVISDGYCLNGNRLRLTGGPYGQAGSTYQTELADFSNITAYSSAGNGPGYFFVQGKNGWTYEYGNSNDGGSTYPSRITASGTSTPYQWLLNKVRDKAGNSYIVTYGTGQAGSVGVGVPLNLSYTPSGAGSSSYDYSVAFAYTTETPDGVESGYIAGGAIVNTNRLSSVTVSRGATTIRKYGFTYELAPTTNRYRLSSVKECADASLTDCLLPTTISYQNGSSGISSTNTSAISATTSVKGAYDFDGNGLQDILYVSGSTVYAVIATASGYGSPINTGITLAAGDLFDAGDVSGSGKDIIMATQGGQWYFYTLNGGAFTATAAGFSKTAEDVGTMVLADINGDGLPDMISGVATDKKVYRRMNNSSGGTISFGSQAVAFAHVCDAGMTCTNYVLSMWPSLAARSKLYDFNNDKRADLILSYRMREPGTPPAEAYKLSYKALGNGQDFVGVGTYYSNAQEYASIPLNFNSDACVDYVFGSSVLISACNGLDSTSLPFSGTYLAAMDWDGDGRIDILIRNGSTIGVYRSLGTSLSGLISTSVPVPSSALVLDQNGDGLDDLADIGISSPFAVSYRLHEGAGTKSDLVTSVTDGYAVSASISYASIAITGNYSVGSGVDVSEREIRSPIHVVTQVTLSDGIGGTYSKAYQYVGARQDIRGRGFLGFQQQTVSDSRAGAPVVKSYYKTAFPYTGLLYQQDVFQSNGSTLISRIVNTTNLATLDNTANNQRYFPYFSPSDINTYEVGGTKNGALVIQRATSFTYDSYGNVTQAVETLTDKDSTAPASPTYNQSWTTTVTNSFTPDTGSNWCVGIPTSTVANRSTTGSSITRTTSFTPDYSMCRVSQKIVEPASGSYKVTTDYGYDVFGNVSSETVTGIGMTGRQTQMGWGATGQFPVSVTNPLSQTTTAGYDYDLGVQTTATDANGLAASFSYDSFGRQTRETRIDGTYTDFTYTDCSASGCQAGDPAGSTGINKMLVTATAKDSGGATIRDDYTYLDQFDRVIVARSRLLGSGYSRVGTQYDALGNVYRQTAPCNVASCSVYWTTNSYDALHRLVSQTRPISASTSTPQTTSYSYLGLTVITTDALNKSRTQNVDPNGWLRRSKDHDNYYQDFNYDAFGSLKTVTDSLSNVLFSANYVYGIGAFQTSRSDMDLGAWSFTPNALGEVVAYTDANGNNFTQTFDALSRMTTQFVTGEGTTTWTWGNNAANYNIGRLASLSKTGGTIEAYTYDNKSRLSQRSITSDAVYTYDYAYASNGQLDTLTYPTSTSSYRLRLKHLYENGLLKQVKDDNASTVFWQANTLNPRGQVSQETLGNGVVTTRAYDAVTGRLSSIQSGIGGGSTLQNESYLTDLVGNITQRQQNNLGLTEDFYYDNLYRLTESRLGSTTNLTLTYDAMGNIASRSDVAGGANWTYHATKKHAVTQAGNASFTYSYDANGNAQTRNGDSIAWSKYNYPTVINGPGKSLAFTYDGNQQRYQQVYTNGSLIETTMYVGGLLEKVTVGSITDWRHYIRVGRQTVAVMSRQSTGTNTTRYMLEDHQGSVANILDGAGTSYVAESFTAFGQRRNPATWDGPCPCPDLAKIAGVSRIGYTGHEAIGGFSMGLIHMNGRVQDAITGRFLSADTYITDPGSTQSYNRYSYVINNPLSRIDPTGFHDADCLDRGDCGHGPIPEIIVPGRRLPADPINPYPAANPRDPTTPARPGGRPIPGQANPSPGEPRSLEEIIVTAAATPQEQCMAPEVDVSADRAYSGLDSLTHNYTVSRNVRGVTAQQAQRLRDLWRNGPNAAPGIAPNTPDFTPILLSTLPWASDSNWIYIRSTANGWVNVTLPGHYFYPGTVTNTVAYDNGVATMTSTGTGSTSRWFQNDALGSAFFAASQGEAEMALIYGGPRARVGFAGSCN